MFGVCAETVSHPLVVVSENGRKFVISNARRLNISKVKIDGCVVSDNTTARCDYLFEIGEPFTSCLYVELKGKDVAHAFDQLCETMTLLKNRHNGVVKECHVVASSIPRIRGGVQGLKIRMLKRHNATLNFHTQQGNLVV